MNSLQNDMGKSNDESSNKQREMDQYNLLTKEEKQLLEKVAGNFIKLSHEDPLDINHMRQFWGYLADILYKERGNLIQNLDELEKQKTDLEHFLIEQPPDSDEYYKILRLIGDVVQLRRSAKDMLSYFSVAHENISKTAGFLYKSQERKYNPKSNKYGDSDNIEQKTNGTTAMKIYPSEFIASKQIRKKRE